MLKQNLEEKVLQNDLNKRISQAKGRLLVEFPYFGSLATKLALRVNDDRESFCSDGVVLEYREEYLRGLGVDELEFVLANGAMHAALAYETRKKNRSDWLWQMASDIAINDMLVQNNMTLPDGARYEKRFEGMYAEEIYAELKSELLHQEESSLQEQPRDDSQESILEEQLFAHAASELLKQHFKEGDTPQSIERFFELTYLSKVDWREELKNALDPFFKDDYVMLPPSKKLLSMGIYLPSTTSHTVRLVIAIDSSGSVDSSLLNTFLSEVDFLMELSHSYCIDLLVCDDTIHSHTRFVTGESLEVQLQGYGATDFRAVFEYIENELEDVRLLLYFSDLQGVFPSQQPPYPVKWITPKEGSVPFGEVIILED
jgi:predicted metal-dependent peptidase